MLRTMVKYGSKYFIFSSTAALFGYPENDTIKEDDLKKPINPYGETKLVVENMLHWQVPLGKREAISVFGSDYRTPDGTCIRDYVHVTDIASAHVLAAGHLSRTGRSDAFNLGSGTGYSVTQIVEASRKVTGHAIRAVAKERRPGDPDKLVASSEKAQQVLGWKRQYATIEDIIASAWRWHQAHPHGYASK
ncbi:hypothetical protein HK405_000911 [Cladochytrium tenue]|nr:hypothetical protein HK405_000911 [Cladochytrium tenue]